EHAIDCDDTERFSQHPAQSRDELSTSRAWSEQGARRDQPRRGLAHPATRRGFAHLSRHAKRRPLHAAGRSMVARLLAPQFLVLYAFAASALAIHYRGRVRLGFGRQLTDHSTIVAPYNVLMYMFSAVPNKPMLPVSAVPDLARLRENWPTIRDEAVNLFDQGRIKAADGYNDWGFNSFFRTGWKRFYLKWYDDPLPSAQRMCPRTVELLQSI